MKYEIWIPLLSIGLLIIVLTIITALGSRKCGQRSKMLQKTLPMIISCNTYPKMLTVFDHLESSVEKYGIEIEDHFKGYFKNE